MSLSDLLTLPATNADVLGIVDKALDWLPPPMRSDEARCLLLAIGRQESGYTTRRQYGNGPAHGLWQFERNGVLAVMHNNRSADYVYRLCRDLGVLYGSGNVFESLLSDDVLAAALARLSLWCDPASLPAIGDIEAAWETYTRCWRPGKPDRERWTDAYSRAVETIKGPAA